MSFHVHKDEVRLAWMDNRDQAKLVIKKVVRRVEDYILTSLDKLYEEALLKGDVLQFEPTEEEIVALMRRALETD